MPKNRRLQQQLIRWGMTIFLTTLVFGIISAPAAFAQYRVVVLPFYSEEGIDVDDAYAADHSRRTIRFINNQLVRHDFEVLNAWARDLAEKEYDRIAERAREDSVRACREMCKRYGADAAYIIWLDVRRKGTEDGYCKAKARLDGEGYDAGGRDLGLGVSKTFNVTRRDCDDAVAEVEKEIGDLVGRKLTACGGGEKSHLSATVAGTQAATGNALNRRLTQNENSINIRLDGATQYEIAEVFGKVINTVTGVTDAKRYSSRVVPDNPQGSFAIWRVKIEDTDPFRLQTNVLKMIHDLLDTPPDANGVTYINGVPYRYTASELDLLKGVRPGDATAREVQFIVDRELARDWEFSGRHDPYAARKQKRTGSGFE